MVCPHWIGGAWKVTEIEPLPTPTPGALVTGTPGCRAAGSMKDEPPPPPPPPPVGPVVSVAPVPPVVLVPPAPPPPNP